MSLARIVVFALALTQAVGFADLVLGDACEEVCDDGGCGTDCLPGVACRCHCPSVMPTLSGSGQAVARRTPPREVTLGGAVERMHASPDPREILHVPKRVA